MGFIDRPQNVWFRGALFQIHLWAGVAIGLYVVAISVSGSVLVFQQDLLDDTRRATAASQHQLSFGEAVEIAQQAHADKKLLYIDNRNRNANVVSVLLGSSQGTLVVNVDRSSGRVVDDSVRQRRHATLSFFEDLHNQLLGGSTGEKINGVGGGLLFLMSLSGIVLWWPGRKNWRRTLSVMWRARWPRLNFDLHVAFGFWTLLLVSMWGLTGLYFGFPFPFRNAVERFTPIASMPRISHWKPTEPVLPVDQFIATAMSTFPGTELAFLTYGVQEQDGAVVVLLSRDRRLPLEISRDLVYFHPSTGEILGTESSARWSWGDKLLMWAYTAHFGDFGGLTTKLIWCILGVVPAGLAVTGYLMWWNRVLKKKWAVLTRRSRETRKQWNPSRVLP